MANGSEPYLNHSQNYQQELAPLNCRPSHHWMKNFDPLHKAIQQDAENNCCLIDLQLLGHLKTENTMYHIKCSRESAK